MDQELTILDPIVSTNVATRSFGYMVFDTLVAMDSRGKFHPQMLEGWTVSEDGLTYVFTLRPGLLWSDGTPVTAEDCVASIRRWGAQDGFGLQLMAATREITSNDTKSFTLELHRPFAFVIEALGKPGNRVPFMMPARIAATSPSVQISEIIGSGPFTFVRSEWRQGDRTVFRRNPNYVPRNEPADGLAGGKVVHIDQAEFVSISDPATRIAALQSGEVDIVEAIPADFIPLLQRQPDVIVKPRQMGIGHSMGFISLNHAYPPFDNPLIRKAA